MRSEYGLHFFSLGEYLLLIFLQCLRTSSFFLNTILTVFNRTLTIVVLCTKTTEQTNQSTQELGLQIFRLCLTGMLIIFFDYRHEWIERCNFIKHVDDMVWRNTSKNIVNQSLIVTSLTSQNQIEMFSCNKKAMSQFRIKTPDCFNVFLKEMQLSLGDSVFNSGIFEKLTFKKTFSNLYDYLSIRHSQMLRDNLLRKAKNKKLKKTNQYINKSINNLSSSQMDSNLLKLQNLSNPQKYANIENYVRQHIFKQPGEIQQQQQLQEKKQKNKSFFSRIISLLYSKLFESSKQQQLYSQSVFDQGKSQEITPLNQDGSFRLANLLDLLEDDLPKGQVDVDILQCYSIINGGLRKFRVSIFKYKGGPSGEKSPLLILCFDEIMKNDFKSMKEQLLESKHFINNILNFFSEQFKSQIALLNDHLVFQNSSNSQLENKPLSPMNKQRHEYSPSIQNQEPLNHPHFISSQESLGLLQPEFLPPPAPPDPGVLSKAIMLSEVDQQKNPQKKKKNERLSEICHLTKLITVKSLIQVYNYSDCQRLKEAKPLPLKISEFSISELIMNSFYFNSKPILIYDSIHQVIHSDKRRLIQVIFNILNLFMRDTQDKNITFIVTDSSTQIDQQTPMQQQQQFTNLKSIQQSSSPQPPVFQPNNMLKNTANLTAKAFGTQFNSLTVMSPTNNNNETLPMLFSDEQLDQNQMYIASRKTSMFSTHKRRKERISFQDQAKYPFSFRDNKQKNDEDPSDNHQLLLIQSQESIRSPHTLSDHRQIISSSRKQKYQQNDDDNDDVDVDLEEDEDEEEEEKTDQINEKTKNDYIYEQNDLIGGANKEKRHPPRSRVLNENWKQNLYSTSNNNQQKQDEEINDSPVKTFCNQQQQQQQQQQQYYNQFPINSLNGKTIHQIHNTEASENENYCENMYSENIDNVIIQTLPTHKNQINSEHDLIEDKDSAKYPTIASSSNKITTENHLNSTVPSQKESKLVGLKPVQAPFSIVHMPDPSLDLDIESISLSRNQNEKPTYQQSSYNQDVQFVNALAQQKQNSEIHHQSRVAKEIESGNQGEGYVLHKRMSTFQKQNLKLNESLESAMQETKGSRQHVQSVTIKPAPRSARFYSPPKIQFQKRQTAETQKEQLTFNKNIIDLQKSTPVYTMPYHLGQKNSLDQSPIPAIKHKSSINSMNLRKPIWSNLNSNKAAHQKLSLDEFSSTMQKRLADDSPRVKSLKNSTEMMGFAQQNKMFNNNNQLSSSQILPKKLHATNTMAGAPLSPRQSFQSNIIIQIQMDDENINFKANNENEPILILATNEIVKLLGPNKKIQISENSISFHLYPNLNSRSLSSNLFAASEQFEQIVDLKELMNPKAIQTIQRIDRAITIDARTCKTIYTIQNKPNNFELIQDNTIHSTLSLSKRDPLDFGQQVNATPLFASSNIYAQNYMPMPQKSLIPSLSRSRLHTKTNDLQTPNSQDQATVFFPGFGGQKGQAQTLLNIPKTQSITQQKQETVNLQTPVVNTKQNQVLKEEDARSVHN